MSHSREEYLVKRISFFSRDLRERREKRDGSEISSSRVAPAARITLFSHTSCEIRDTKYEIRGLGLMGC